MVLEVVVNRRLLVGGHRKVVGETATRVNDFVGRALGVQDRLAGGDLGGTDRGYVRASPGEAGVEDTRRAIIVPAKVGVDALCKVQVGQSGSAKTASSIVCRLTVAVARDTIVSGREEEGHALKTELCVLVALTDLVCQRQVGLVIGVRRRDDIGRLELAAGALVLGVADG